MLDWPDFLISDESAMWNRNFGTYIAQRALAGLEHKQCSRCKMSIVDNDYLLFEGEKVRHLVCSDSVWRRGQNQAYAFWRKRVHGEDPPLGA